MGVVLPQPIQFGKYSLFERIGRGGMADVFKARIHGPAGFERVFVIKRILPHLSDDPQFTKMFIEEAKLSARLNHPNIVQVFELGNVEQEYFMAMEYVKGRDLADTMRTHWARVGPPRPELVAFIGREMCRALGHAHELVGDDGSPVGMIHRDVSPSNVMLSYDGAVKILDFGIAKALGGDKKEESATQRGTLKGKFAYMAPEQTQGSDVDRRIDVFASGIVLHEMLTGRRLFKGENDLQTVEKVRVCDVAPPSLQNPLCPPELDAIVLKALSRDRDDRFNSAHDMADALDDVVHSARFQPTHLAALMRELFPSEAGGALASSAGLRATGASMSTPMSSASLSRPHSGMRSPTVPPVSVSRSTVSGVKTGRGHSSVVSVLGAGTRKPIWKSGGAIAAGLGLVGVAFGGGVIFMRSQAVDQPTVAAVGSEEKKTIQREAELTLQSWPDGADVFVAGDPKTLGRTPIKKRFKFHGDDKIRLVFRKPNYEDMEKEVAYYSGLVTATMKAGESGRGGMARPTVQSLTVPGTATSAVGETAQAGVKGSSESSRGSSEASRGSSESSRGSEASRGSSESSRGSSESSRGSSGSSRRRSGSSASSAPATAPPPTTSKTEATLPGPDKTSSGKGEAKAPKKPDSKTLANPFD